MTIPVAVLQQPSLYPRQEELHNSARIVLTLPTLNLFLAEALDHGIVKTMAYSSLAAVSRGAIRVYF